MILRDGRCREVLVHKTSGDFPMRIVGLHQNDVVVVVDHTLHDERLWSITRDRTPFVHELLDQAPVGNDDRRLGAHHEGIDAAEFLSPFIEPTIGLEMSSETEDLVDALEVGSLFWQLVKIAYNWQSLGP